MENPLKAASPTVANLELSQLDLRYEGYRLRQPRLEDRLLPLIAQEGIREPLQGVGGPSPILLDGFKRYRCARRLHLKKSWLSREILFVGLFGAGWLTGFVLPEMKWITSLLGMGLIYSMAKVYQLRPIPT